MGLKSLTNSRKGRAAIALTSMITFAALVSGGLYHSIVYYPRSLENTLEGQLKEDANGWPIYNLELLEEASQLPELPSTTLSYLASDSDSLVESSSRLRTHPVGFPLSTLNNEELESLLNVAVAYQETEISSSGPNYSFKFYSSSLGDYSLGGAYRPAAEQFLSAYTLGLSELDFTSKPLPTGGREVDIIASLSYDVDRAQADEAAQLWRTLVSKFSSEELTGQDTVVNLTMKDPTSFSIKTVLASPQDAESAIDIYPALWTTFAAYTHENSLSFMKVTAVEYTVERSSEDSILVVTVDESQKESSNLRQRLIDISVDSKGEIVIIWSYNTYFVTKDDPTPFLTFESSSRNW